MEAVIIYLTNTAPPQLPRPCLPRWQLYKSFEKAVDNFIGAAVGREGFSRPHLQGWQVHPNLLHHPRAS